MKSRWLIVLFLVFPLYVMAQEIDARSFLKAAEVASRDNSAVLDSVVYWVTESSVFQKLEDGEVAEQDSFVFRVKRRGNEELERTLIFSSKSEDEAENDDGEKSKKSDEKEEFSVALNFDPDSSVHVFTKVDATDSTMTFDFEPKLQADVHEGFGTVILGRDDKLLRLIDLHISKPKKKALKKMDMMMRFKKINGYHQPTDLEVAGKVKALLGLVSFDFRMKSRFSEFEILPDE